MHNPFDIDTVATGDLIWQVVKTLQEIVENIEEYYVTWEKDKIDKITNQPIVIDNKKQTRPINSTKKGRNKKKNE